MRAGGLGRGGRRSAVPTAPQPPVLKDRGQAGVGGGPESRLIRGRGAGSTVDEIKLRPGWTAAPEAEGCVWKLGLAWAETASLPGICGSKNRLPVSPPHTRLPSRCAAGPPARADICSLIYLRFWEGGRGAQLRQLGGGVGGSTPSRRGSGEDGQRLFPVLARTSPEEATGRAGRRRPA